MKTDLLSDEKNKLWKAKGVVYCYTNKINGKKYIGQTKNDIRKRHREHVHSSSKDKDTMIFHKAINKYGIENFKLEILLMDCENFEKLNEFEVFFIKRYKTLCIENGYNISDGGKNGSPYSGKTDEEIKEIRRKISESRKGKYCGENSPMYGKHPSEETRIKQSLAKKGKKRSKEVVEKMKKTRKGENNNFYGKHHDEKSKDKMRSTRKKYTKENHPRATKIVAVSINDENDILFFDYINQAKDKGFPTVSLIRKCCKKEIESYKGYKWYYEYDYEELKNKSSF